MLQTRVTFSLPTLYLEEPIFKTYKQMIYKLCSDVHAYYQKFSWLD